MCRLFGYVSKEPTTLEETLGQPALDQFVRLSRLHGDGWGTAWLETSGARGAPQNVYRSPLPAYADPRFAEQTHSVPSRARIVHLRWATPGLPVQEANTHPFSADGLSLAHNGSIMPPERLEELLEPDILGSLVGGTDSERYLGLLRHELRQSDGDTVTAARRTVLALRQRFPIASLNALVLTSTELVVVHANSIEDAPTPNQLPNGTCAPPDHLEAYFLMRWRRGDDGTLAFASSGLPDEGWVPLADNSLTRVDLTTLSVTTDIIPIDEIRTTLR